MAIVVSCDPLPPDPPTPPEQKVKYLSKTLLSGASVPWESCTWNSKGQLETYKLYITGDIDFMSFLYDSLERISRIDCYHWEYGNGYYELFWKNDIELDYVDFYSSVKSPMFFDSTFYLESRYTYTYDQSKKCIKIHRDGTWNYYTHLEWEGENMSKLYRINGADTSYRINCTAFDNRQSPYSAFPKTPIMQFVGLPLYDLSKNNPLQHHEATYDYDYDYDEDGYPIRKYETYSNGERIHKLTFEYEELNLATNYKN